MSYVVFNVTRRLTQEEFSKYLNIMRSIARFDRNARVWVFDDVKARVSATNAIQLIVDSQHLPVVAVKGNEAVPLWRFLEDYYSYVISKGIPSTDSVVLVIDGNLALISVGPEVRVDVKSAIKSMLTMRAKKFDITARRYIEIDVRYYTEKGDTIMTYRGVAKMVVEKLRSLNVPVELRFKEKPALSVPDEVYEDVKKDEVLRDYQKEAVIHALNDIKAYGGALVSVPTGGGKTVIFARMFRALARHTDVSPSFVIVPSVDLVHQFATMLRKFAELEYVSEIRAGSYVFDAPVYVSTYASVVRKVTKGLAGDIGNVTSMLRDVEKLAEEEEGGGKLSDLVYDKVAEKYKTAKLVVVDEAHHTPAETLYYVMNSNSNVHIGLTATPFRADRLDLLLYGATNYVSYRIPVSLLVEKGYLVPVRVEFYRFGTEIPVASIRNLNFTVKVRRYIEDPSFQDVVRLLVDEVVGGNMLPSVVYTPFVFAISKITEVLDGLGVKYDVLTGGEDARFRDSVLEKYRGGYKGILVATNVITEGVDIPPLRSMVVTVPTSSNVRAVQLVGRLTRTAPGKAMGVMKVMVPDIFGYMVEDMREALKDEFEVVERDLDS